MWSKSAWVFVSIAQCGRTGEAVALKNVLFAGDHINRAIISRQELIEAVNHLSGLDLVAVDEDALTPTARGVDLYRRAADAVSLHATCINATGLIDQLGEYTAPGWTISTAKHERAIEQYRADFAAAYERVKEKRDLA
jgi:hypothetical protein